MVRLGLVGALALSLTLSLTRTLLQVAEEGEHEGEAPPQPQQRHGGGGVGEHHRARGAAAVHLLLHLPAQELAQRERGAARGLTCALERDARLGQIVLRDGRAGARVRVRRR